MAWETTLVLIVRHLINDIDSTAYSDDRVKTSIVISATLLSFDVDFDKKYTIDIDAATISPDPFTSFQDTAFINLTALRTAYLILGSEAKLASKLGLRITDGPTTVDLSGRLSSALRLLDGAKSAYEKAKIEYLVGNARAGSSVSTPITVPFISGGDGLE